MIKVLNLYSGLGGNRKHWQDVEVTAVEKNEKIVNVYRSLFPNDAVVVDDAQDYLLNHFEKFDFIWASPPCQSHTRMIKSGKNRKPRYTDFSLYEVIKFLQDYFKGKWVVENVKPHYSPLIPPAAQLGRHLIWSNFKISNFDVPSPKGFITKTNTEGANQLKEWLGINYEGNIYYEGNHCPAQVLRNCIHPDLGLHVFEEMKKA